MKASARPAKDITGSVRVAIQADAAHIARIYNESIAARDSTMVLEPVDVGYVKRWLEALGEREVMLVISGEDQVLGWGIAKNYSDRPGYSRAAETSVFLDRQFTGCGLGSTMQAALIEHCRSQGFHHLVAKVWADNEASTRLHYRFGYELVGVQREIGWVDGRFQDVAILGRVLTPG